MTGHTHDSAAHADSPRPGPVAGDATATTAARPRWLLPGLVAGIVVGALVVAGVLSFSTVLYAGLLGGMLLMHLGGHGGHGGHSGHGDHDGGATPDAASLKGRPHLAISLGGQARKTSSTTEPQRKKAEARHTIVTSAPRPAATDPALSLSLGTMAQDPRDPERFLAGHPDGCCVDHDHSPASEWTCD